MTPSTMNPRMKAPPVSSTRRVAGFLGLKISFSLAMMDTSSRTFYLTQRLSLHLQRHTVENSHLACCLPGKETYRRFDDHRNTVSPSRRAQPSSPVPHDHGRAVVPLGVWRRSLSLALSGHSFAPSWSVVRRGPSRSQSRPSGWTGASLVGDGRGPVDGWSALRLPECVPSISPLPPSPFRARSLPHDFSQNLTS